jgi:hypothetical protein
LIKIALIETDYDHKIIKGLDILKPRPRSPSPEQWNVIEEDSKVESEEERGIDIVQRINKYNINIKPSVFCGGNTVFNKEEEKKADTEVSNY